MATPISLTVGFVKTAQEDPLGCGSSRLAASSQSDPEVFSRFLKRLSAHFTDILSIKLIIENSLNHKIL
jgi:hypothetical protein